MSMSRSRSCSTVSHEHSGSVICTLFALLKVDLLMMLGFCSVGFFLFRRDEIFLSVCNSPFVSERRCRKQMQMSSFEALPVQELPGLEEFHSHFSWDGPFSDASHACLVALQKAALLCVIWGCKESPSRSSFLGSCKEASMLMTVFIQSCLHTQLSITLSQRDKSSCHYVLK